MSHPQPEQVAAPVRIRLLAAVYEALLLAALLMPATAIFIAIAGDAREQPLHIVLQIYLLAISAAYFVWSWTGGRRTLPMRTWRLRLVDRRGAPPGAGVALARFLIAAATWPLAALPLWWALFDRERHFLHDRAVGTRLVR
ncbi:MAG: RDD family protein, partial [Betaproteobacteria bacterium]|nr:RDD family protein [Betaproteobacteria bacterium]